MIYMNNLQYIKYNYVYLEYSGDYLSKNYLKNHPNNIKSQKNKKCKRNETQNIVSHTQNLQSISIRTNL